MKSLNKIIYLILCIVIVFGCADDNLNEQQEVKYSFRFYGDNIDYFDGILSYYEGIDQVGKAWDKDGGTISWHTECKTMDATSRSLVYVKYDGTLWGLGRNENGQLGPGPIAIKPVQITNTNDWRSAVCNDHVSAGIKTDGSLWAWSKKFTLRRIGSSNDWSQVVCYKAELNYRMFGLKNDGTIWIIDLFEEEKTIKLWSSKKWKYIAFGKDNYGDSQFYGIDDDGKIWYASNFSETVISYLEQPIEGNNWKQVAIGKNFVLLLSNDGTVYSYGENQSLQLGDASRKNDDDEFKKIPGLSNVEKIACGYQHALALVRESSSDQFNNYNYMIYAWGDNSKQQIAAKQSKSLPFRLIPCNGNVKFICNEYTTIIEGGFGPVPYQ